MDDAGDSGGAVSDGGSERDERLWGSRDCFGTGSGDGDGDDFISSCRRGAAMRDSEL